MRIKIIGAGWYGCHLTVALLRDGHDVELHESSDHIFAGASGGNPARLHKGFHYPRSRLTRAACQEHADMFEAEYGHLTHSVPINIYAIAANESLLDFGTYTQVLRGEVEFVTILNPSEFGLQNVEGAILTGERHIVIEKAQAHFENVIAGNIHYNSRSAIDSADAEMVIDCSFCANDAENIDRFEPCVTALLEGSTDRAVTIMDGGFPSLFAWNEDRGLSSLTSAKFTPLSKTCKTWTEARAILDTQKMHELHDLGRAMIEQMAHYWPEVSALYKIVDYKLTIRAMPRSAADSRLVDVVKIGDRALRVRAGKIDAVFHAERVIKEHLAAMQQIKIRKVA